MQYRALGQTGLKVSALSFGASPLGGVFGDIDETEGICSVRLAVEYGVNLFDVAPYYGLTKAEDVLGRALSEIARDKFYIATKAGRYGDRDFDFSAERVVRSVEESLRRLRVDYIDLIQCHDIEFGSLDQIVEETIPALAQIVAQGKARFIGITGLPLKIFRYVVDRTKVDTILSYCHYCLNYTALSRIIPLLQQRGVGIINAAPLAMGLLRKDGPESWHPAPSHLKAKCAEAARYCQARGANLSRLALQFSVANPDIATTVVGMADPAMVHKNVQWISQPLDGELLAAVQAILEPVHNKTWQTGRPENND